MTAIAPIKKNIPVRPYHSGAKRRIKSVEGEYYGFEMEVDFPGKQMRGYGASVPNGNVVRSRYQLDAETDGSLNNSGIELITKRPLKVTEIRGKWMNSILARMTEDMGVLKGKQPNNYGLHINVNLEGMTVVEVAAFFATLNFLMDQPSVQTSIMERGKSYNGLSITLKRLALMVNEHYNVLRGKRSIEEVILHMSHVGRLREAALPFARLNYAGIRHANAPIAEVRGFHMNTDIEAFKKKAELVQKARRFANDNAELMLNFYVTCLETGTDTLEALGEEATKELLDDILATPLDSPLVKREFTPPTRALELFAQRLTADYSGYVDTVAGRRAVNAPIVRADGTLGTRK